MEPPDSAGPGARPMPVMIAAMLLWRLTAMAAWKRLADLTVKVGEATAVIIILPELFQHQLYQPRHFAQKLPPQLKGTDYLLVLANVKLCDLLKKWHLLLHLSKLCRCLLKAAMWGPALVADLCPKPAAGLTLVVNPKAGWGFRCCKTLSNFLDRARQGERGSTEDWSA